MLSKYIELNHELKEEKVINHENVPISYILKKIGERKSEDVLESVIGSKQLIYPDYDWGFLNTILTCYNNHWILKTSPEDWWNIIGYTIATAIDDKKSEHSL